MASLSDSYNYFIEFTFPEEINTPTRFIFVTRQKINSHVTHGVRVTVVVVGLQSTLYLISEPRWCKVVATQGVRYFCPTLTRLDFLDRFLSNNLTPFLGGK